MDEHSPDEIQLKIQALADNELPEAEIAEVMDAVQGSYEYREQYVELLQLKRRLSGLAVRVPGPDWVAAAEKRLSRKLFRGTGTILIVVSYVALLGAGILALFRDSELPVYIPVLVGVGAVGLLALFAGAIADRLRERRTDKYRGVIR